jgi:hypothetical protein
MYTHIERPHSQESDMFFGTCRSKVDVRKKFNELALSMHPDKGGSQEAFVALMDEYTTAKARFGGGLHGCGPTQGEEYNQHPPQSQRKKSNANPRWWANMHGPSWWDFIEKELHKNLEEINRVNRESLQREEDAYVAKPYTHEERCLLYTDFDTRGHVGAIFLSRKKKPMVNSFWRCRRGALG